MPDEPEEPLYDPDRMVPEDLDFTDAATVNAYLDDPVTQKLGDDVGRAFLQLPAAEQQRQLSDYLAGLRAKRADVSALLADIPPDAPHLPIVMQIQDTIERNIEAAILRMHELDTPST